MKSSGFTMIELLVVIAIIVSLTGVFTNNYNNFNKVERLRQLAKDFKVNLRLAQTNAMSGLKPSGCGTLNGYRITFTTSSYTLAAVCNGAVVANSGPVISLPSDVTFTSPPAQVTFSGLNGVPMDLSNSTVDFTLSSTPRTYKIRINNSGDVTDLGLQ